MHALQIESESLEQGLVDSLKLRSVRIQRFERVVQPHLTPDPGFQHKRCDQNGAATPCHPRLNHIAPKVVLLHREKQPAKILHPIPADHGIRLSCPHELVQPRLEQRQKLSGDDPIVKHYIVSVSTHNGQVSTAWRNLVGNVPDGTDY